jgi:enoyl-CoA hydratase/carnithine racemase
MIMFSRKINATEALETGLINQVSAPGRLMDDARALAEKLATRPPVAVSCVLRAIAAGAYEGLDAGLKVEEEGSAVKSSGSLKIAEKVSAPFWKNANRSSKVNN